MVKKRQLSIFQILKKGFSVFSFVFLLSCLTPASKRTSVGAGALGTSNGSSNGGSGGTLGLEGTQIEINFAVDPYDGTYTSKLTLPKDFSGFLYLSGINISELNSSIVKVRFLFGKDGDEIVVPAVVGTTTGSGITGTTQVTALIADLSTAPFSNLTLKYDLYDYNNYEVGEEAINDPYSRQLFCRGLKVEDDPTNENGSCVNPGDICLYSYAKVLDAGLYYPLQNGGENFIRPSEAKIDLTGNGYNSDTDENKIKKCLPDNGLLSYTGSPGNYSINTNGGLVASPSVAGVAVQSAINPSLPGQVSDFIYRGPYFPTDKLQWEIGPLAAVHDHLNDSGNTPRGLFARTVDGSVETGYISYMFPRASYKNLVAGTSYIGSDSTDTTIGNYNSYSVTAQRELKTMLSSELSEAMDGCALRATSQNQEAEHIGSCQVTATIEVVRDHGTANETVLVSSKNLKIQLVNSDPPGSVNNDPFNSGQTCSSQASCGAEECCFSGVCVGEELVSTCFSGSQTQGALGNSQSCTNDLECSSLCCRNGSCQPHNNILNPPLLCGKFLGESCISSSYCAQQNVNVCRKELGPNIGGVQTCSIQCYTTPTFGECTNGTCAMPPTPPTVPNDNLTDCSDALPPL